MSAQFICVNNGIECPGCGARLKKVSEQDRRVAVMKHEGELSCNWAGKSFRVDRNTGHGEFYYEA